MGWIAYAFAWLAAAMFWTVAGASASGRPFMEIFPYSALVMTIAAVMGTFVWRLTGIVPWDGRALRFGAIHALALIPYSAVYSTVWVWPDVVAGRSQQALASLRTSPVQVWNLLFGCWLYLIVAGVSYAIRAHRRVREQETAASEARLLAQQAQLAALRAQINPHFLFNALHTVGALVSTDPPRADKALECLGDLLRYALDARDELRFSEEWRFTENYLAFEQLRLGPRLRVSASIDDAAHDVIVPPLILQPLVENAVRHGIASRPDGGRIGIHAGLVRDRLVLRVTDDGPGAQGVVRDGMGLGSVRRRLAALYGTAASVTTGNASGGYIVSVEVPVTWTRPC